MDLIKIALLHLWILAVQVFYIYLSNKDRLKNDRYLYLIAVPVAAAFPAIIGGQDIHAYSLYEYAVIFCMIFVAVVDASVAVVSNRQYLTDTEGMSLTLSYFLICAVSVFCGDVSMAVRLVTLFLLAGAFMVFCIMKKRSAAELLRSLPVAALSVACSWAFLRFGL